MVDNLKTELSRSMRLAAEREDYQSAADIQLILKGINNGTYGSLFDETDITKLQSKVHSITGDGEVMKLFNELLGVQSC